MPSLVSRLEANTKKNIVIEFSEVKVPDIESGSAEQLHYSIKNEVSDERQWSVLSGLVLFVGGLLSFYLGFLSNVRLEQFTIIRLILLLCFFGFGATCIMLGIKSLFLGIWKHVPDNPIKLAEMFYKEALLTNPLNPHNMLELLSPAAVSVIPKPWSDALTESWSAAQSTCHNIFGSKNDNAFFFSRITASPRLNSSTHDLIVEIDFEHWKNYDSWNLQRNIIVRFRNTAVKYKGNWKMFSPLPGDCREVPLTQ